VIQEHTNTMDMSLVNARFMYISVKTYLLLSMSASV